MEQLEWMKYSIALKRCWVHKMSVTIKSQREIEIMRRAGEILAITHDEIAKAIKPGVSTKQIERVAEEVIRSYKCTPSFKGLYEFPGAICISVNEEVVHGIPSKKRILKEGDIVSIDAGVCYKGYHSDAARTHGVGQISDEANRLIEVTKQSFFEGMKFAKEGNHLFDISRAIQQYVESNGFSVVRDLVGHGIGTEVHEDPQIPNFAEKAKGIKLKAGMTLAVEPMVNIGAYDVEWLEDEWTVVTKDHSLSAHYENTILITEDGYEILSCTK